jgi:hypothetical protein
VPNKSRAFHGILRFWFKMESSESWFSIFSVRTRLLVRLQLCMLYFKSGVLCAESFLCEERVRVVESTLVHDFNMWPIIKFPKHWGNRDVSGERNHSDRVHVSEYFSNSQKRCNKQREYVIWICVTPQSILKDSKVLLVDFTYSASFRSSSFLSLVLGFS